ncbi:hypothetical protein MST23_09175 [Pediococcus acidilactici]|uniref:hypothetical protein n=1 Tax=Pediococcus acidilactici TaxID=1254 RepID=UPI001FB8A504|nr:hypothetical protein [Pediococcus acidilactici]MCJ2192985.1 hypothetical protein [Pediococcus acidilactici]
MKEKDEFNPLFQGNFGTSKNDDYSLIMQNNATNQLSRINTNNNAKHLMEDTVTTFKQITATFKGKKYSVQDAQNFDILVIKHIQDSNHENNTVVQIPLREYMAIRGNKSRTSTIRSLENSLKNLLHLSVSYNSKYGDDDKKHFDQSFGGMNIFQDLDYGITRPGYITVNFTTRANQLITQRAMPMPYHKLLFRLNPRTEAPSFYILRRVLENKITNYGEQRADRMKIATLLKDCPAIPSYGKVMKGNKNVNARIIQPFFTAVERLKEAFDYSYITKDGKPFDYEQGVTYAEFSEAELVIISWHNYPDYFAKSIKNARKRYLKAKQTKK